MDGRILFDTLLQMYSRRVWSASQWDCDDDPRQRRQDPKLVPAALSVALHRQHDMPGVLRVLLYANDHTAVRLLAHVERCEAVWRLHGRDLGCERVLASDLLLKQVDRDLMAG